MLPRPDVDRTAMLRRPRGRRCSCCHGFCTRLLIGHIAAPSHGLSHASGRRVYFTAARWERSRLLMLWNWLHSSKPWSLQRAGCAMHSSGRTPNNAALRIHQARWRNAKRPTSIHAVPLRGHKAARQTGPPRGGSLLCSIGRVSSLNHPRNAENLQSPDINSASDTLRQDLACRAAVPGATAQP